MTAPTPFAAVFVDYSASTIEDDRNECLCLINAIQAHTRATPSKYDFHTMLITDIRKTLIGDLLCPSQ